MLHDVVVIGAGPVGATLALALAGGELDIVALDARRTGTIARADRSLALSHGTRLIYERLGVWSDVAAAPHAVTPITVIDISQRSGFGAARLDAGDHNLPALGYVVSYRALQAALDTALARAGVCVEHGLVVNRVTTTPAYACIAGERDGVGRTWTSRLAAIADGGGDAVVDIVRRRHDYGQVALVARVWTRGSHGGVAFERFTSHGPMALLPEGDHYGLVWTTTPERGDALAQLPEREFLKALGERFGSRAGHFERVVDRRTFPLTLEFAGRVVADRVVLVGNAAQALHPVGGQGFNLGVRDAWELAQELLGTTTRDQIGAREGLAAYARRRRTDRWASIAFTHGLLGAFGNDSPLLRWPRGLALTLLDTLPPVKRSFTRAMLFGFH
jgi:2-octaprenyl-6-methoxyphenol hydroxylase